MTTVHFHSLHQIICYVEVWHKLSARTYMEMAGTAREAGARALLSSLAGQQGRLAGFAARLETGLEDRPLDLCVASVLTAVDVQWPPWAAYRMDADLACVIEVAAAQRQHLDTLVQMLLDHAGDSAIQHVGRQLALVHRRELLRMAAEVNALFA